MKAVVKKTAYVLSHVPEMLPYGTSFGYPSKEGASQHLRSYEDVVSYAPNQSYIGNLFPQELKKLSKPFFDKANLLKNASEHGTFGEISSQEIFYALLMHVDVFSVVLFNKDYIAETLQPALKKHPLLNNITLSTGDDAQTIQELINHEDALPLYSNTKIIGCVKRAHDKDINLNSHIMLENLSSKATAVLAFLHLEKQGVDINSIDFILEVSEEACGDENQRGGGNFAKAIGEIVNAKNAGGCDIRSFCAAPVHGLIHASALIQAGIYKNIVIVAGGSTAKLGMNAKSHIAKNIPVLEDVMGAFAFLISEDDQESPILNTHIIGKIPIGVGSSPQIITDNLVLAPLVANNIDINTIDYFSPELHNPEITENAGAGDVPLSNYKMIAALSIMKGFFKKEDMNSFIDKKGIYGFAPTQGHIPSGVPFLGYARQGIMNGDFQNTFFIGKGSLFLARMTNLFDGISILLEKNSPSAKTSGSMTPEEESIVKKTVLETLKKASDILLQEKSHEK